MSRADELRGLVKAKISQWRSESWGNGTSTREQCADELEALLTRTEAAPVADGADVIWRCHMRDQPDVVEFARNPPQNPDWIGRPYYTHPKDAGAAVILSMLDKRIADERNQMRRWALLCFRDAAMSAKGKGDE